MKQAKQLVQAGCKQDDEYPLGTEREREKERD